MKILNKKNKINFIRLVLIKPLPMTKRFSFKIDDHGIIVAAFFFVRKLMLRLLFTQPWTLVLRQNDFLKVKVFIFFLNPSRPRLYLFPFYLPRFEPVIFLREWTL